MEKLPRNVLSVTIVNGVKTTVYKSRKAPKSKMRSKSSRGFVQGTSGIATGFPSAVKFATLA
jgi:hypothetical protein